jgi:hypothetical protein
MRHLPKILALLGLVSGAVLTASGCTSRGGAPDDSVVDEAADQASSVIASSEENTSETEDALRKRFFYHDYCQDYWRCLDRRNFRFCVERFPFARECDEYDRRFGYGEFNRRHHRHHHRRHFEGHED